MKKFVPISKPLQRDKYVKIPFCMETYEALQNWATASNITVTELVKQMVFYGMAANGEKYGQLGGIQSDKAK
jgi:hypothetical protein